MGWKISNNLEINPKEMQNLLKQEHLLSREKKRKLMFQEILYRKRLLQTQSKQRTLWQLFALEEPQDIQMMENIKLVKQIRRDKGKEISRHQPTFKKKA